MVFFYLHSRALHCIIKQGFDARCSVNALDIGTETKLTAPVTKLPAPVTKLLAHPANALSTRLLCESTTRMIPAVLFQQGQTSDKLGSAFLAAPDSCPVDAVRRLTSPSRCRDASVPGGTGFIILQWLAHRHPSPAAVPALLVALPCYSCRGVICYSLSSSRSLVQLQHGLHDSPPLSRVLASEALPCHRDRLPLTPGALSQPVCLAGSLVQADKSGHPSRCQALQHQQDLVQLVSKVSTPTHSSNAGTRHHCTSE